MKIDYNITKYFEDNDMFDDITTDGLKIVNNDDTILISGSAVDLVNLADLLVNLVLSKDDSHIHIDDFTLLDKESDYKEIIIEKIGKNGK